MGDGERSSCKYMNGGQRKEGAFFFSLGEHGGGR